MLLLVLVLLLLLVQLVLVRLMLVMRLGRDRDRKGLHCDTHFAFSGSMVGVTRSSLAILSMYLPITSSSKLFWMASAVTSGRRRPKPPERTNRNEQETNGTNQSESNSTQS